LIDKIPEAHRCNTPSCLSTTWEIKEENVPIVEQEVVIKIKLINCIIFTYRYENAPKPN